MRRDSGGAGPRMRLNSPCAQRHAPAPGYGKRRFALCYTSAMDHEEVGRFWNENAETWTRLARAGYDVYRDHFNSPAFLELLPDVRGLAGLDIGCGEGHNTRLLARRGARTRCCARCSGSSSRAAFSSSRSPTPASILRTAETSGARMGRRTPSRWGSISGTRTAKSPSGCSGELPPTCAAGQRCGGAGAPRAPGHPGGRLLPSRARAQAIGRAQCRQAGRQASLIKRVPPCPRDCSNGAPNVGFPGAFCATPSNQVDDRFTGPSGVMPFGTGPPQSSR